MLTLVIGLSVTQAIRSNLGLQAQIKWPNDVVLNGKKLVGILTEMSAQMNYIEYLVTGIGINANLREFPEELEDKATSLQKEIGHKVNRSALIAECMEKIEENYEIFVKTQDLSGLMAAYQEALVNQDQRHLRVLRFFQYTFIKFQPGQFPVHINCLVHCLSLYFLLPFIQLSHSQKYYINFSLILC